MDYAVMPRPVFNTAALHPFLTLYVVQASAGGASESPQALDSPTRCRLKA